MSNRRKSSSFSDVQLYSGGYSPFETAGQRALSREQEAFDYGQLDQKYPVQGVRPVVPSYIQKQLDEEEVIRKSQELEMRRREAQLNIYDSQINQERAMYEQIPMARQALAELNPADDDFLNQLITQQANNPLAYENTDFQQTVVNPLIRRHEMLQRNKLELESRQKPEQIQTASPKDYEDMVVRRNALLGKKTLDELQTEDPDTAFAVEQLNRMISDYQQQNVPRGGFAPQPPIAPSVPSPTAAPTPQPQGGGLRALQSLIGE